MAEMWDRETHVIAGGGAHWYIQYYISVEGAQKVEIRVSQDQAIPFTHIYTPKDTILYYKIFAQIYFCHYIHNSKELETD